MINFTFWCKRFFMWNMILHLHLYTITRIVFQTRENLGSISIWNKRLLLRVSVLAVCIFWDDLFRSNKWDNVFENGPSKICGRQPLKHFAWSILEYFAQGNLWLPLNLHSSDSASVLCITNIFSDWVECISPLAIILVIGAADENNLLFCR